MPVMFVGYNCCVTCTLLKIAQKADGKKEGHDVVEKGGATTFCADALGGRRAAHNARSTGMQKTVVGMHREGIHRCTTGAGVLILLVGLGYIMLWKCSKLQTLCVSTL